MQNYTVGYDFMDCIEICAGAGGQALGLEQSGFEPQVLVEIDRTAAQTLQFNRPSWKVENQDIRAFSATAYRGIDLLAGGIPCPPFSIAGKQLGRDDERDLFPEVIRLVDEARPKAIMLENVRGFLDSKFTPYRESLVQQLNVLGYSTQIGVFNASDYGVSQLRPRVVIVALQHRFKDRFEWPQPSSQIPQTVGRLLFDLMYAHGWEGAELWSHKAASIAPTIVGGSKKHGGPDLGPTRAKRAWANLGVDGLGIANEAPFPEFSGNPRLTNRMVARIQGFPDHWNFVGSKTAIYRQIGNAFPPPVARAMAEQIRFSITSRLFASVEVAA